MSKKLEAAAKQKDCEVIRPWIKSTVNHLMFSVKSSGGNTVLVQAKWESIVNHVMDIHEHDTDIYPACPHPATYPRTKAWLKPGKLMYIVRRIMKSILLTLYQHITEVIYKTKVQY